MRHPATWRLDAETAQGTNDEGDLPVAPPRRRRGSNQGPRLLDAHGVGATATGSAFGSGNNNGSSVSSSSSSSFSSSLVSIGTHTCTPKSSRPQVPARRPTVWEPFTPPGTPPRSPQRRSEDLVIVIDSDQEDCVLLDCTPGTVPGIRAAMVEAPGVHQSGRRSLHPPSPDGTQGVGVETSPWPGWPPPREAVFGPPTRRGSRRTCSSPPLRQALLQAWGPHGLAGGRALHPTAMGVP